MIDAASPGIDVRLKSDEYGAVAYLIIDNQTKLNTLNRELMTNFIRQVETLAGCDDRTLTQLGSVTAVKIQPTRLEAPNRPMRSSVIRIHRMTMAG